MQRQKKGQKATREPGQATPGQRGIATGLRQDLLDAYKLKGGTEWLRGLRDKDFCGLLGRVLPKEVAADLKLATEGPALPPFVIQLAPAADEKEPGAKADSKATEKAPHKHALSGGAE